MTSQNSSPSGARPKSKPTPTRAEREAARKRPLVPADRGEAKRAARAATQAERAKARVGIAKGEERYLPARDKGPQRRYIRDFVDARFSVGELMLPAMFLYIVLTYATPLDVMRTVTLALYVFLLIIVIDCWTLWFSLRRRIGAKFGNGTHERGWVFYAIMRSLQFRPMRLPKPQVKYFAFPE